MVDATERTEGAGLWTEGVLAGVGDCHDGGLMIACDGKDCPREDGGKGKGQGISEERASPMPRRPRRTAANVADCCSERDAR